MPSRRPSTRAAGGPGVGAPGLGGVALALAALLLAALLLAAAPMAVCGLRWDADATSSHFEWVELPDSPEWGAQPAADAPLGSSAALGGARGLLRNIPR